MIAWLEKNGNAVQAITGLITMLIAIAALVGVKVQIDASERIQQAQSARDIYREYLNLSISKPEFATPDVCAMKDAKERGAYDNYVQYMLYAGEQILSVDPEWEPTMRAHLEPHKETLCGDESWGGDTPEVRALVSKFRAQSCKGFVSACEG